MPENSDGWQSRAFRQRTTAMTKLGSMCPSAGPGAWLWRGFVVATLAVSLSACSGDDDASLAPTSTGEAGVQQAELKSEASATSSRFKSSASAAEFAEAWPYGF